MVVQPASPATLDYVQPAQGISMTILIPAQAVTKTTELVMETRRPEDVGLPGSGFALAVFALYARVDNVRQENFVFRQPIHFTMEYTEASLAGHDESGLILTYWDGSRWVEASTTCQPPSIYQRDESHNRLSVDVCHLSTFALLFPHKIFLPTLSH